MIRWLQSPLLDDLAQEFGLSGISLSTDDIREQLNPAFTFKISHLPVAAAAELEQALRRRNIVFRRAAADRPVALFVSFCHRKQIWTFINEISAHLPALAHEFRDTLKNMSQSEFQLQLPGRILSLDRPLIMGILNVTPDSFSDGGRYLSPEAAVARAMQMVAEGADLIDIGAESTRPGAAAVPAEEEWRRIEPVLKSIRDKSDIPISVDTYKSVVARRAVQSGADMINDISGLTFDAEMAHVIARARIPVVLMHIKGTPKDMQVNPRYENLMEEIVRFLAGRIATARDAGIKQIIIDPGIGFGKRWEDNFEIHRRLAELKILGCPILVGPSRKSFIGRLLGLPPENRVWGTAAAAAISIQNGAHILRMHDVRQMAEVAAVAREISRQKFPL